MRPTVARAVAVAAAIFIVHWASGYGLLVSEEKGERTEPRFDHIFISYFAECGYWIGFEVIKQTRKLFPDEVSEFNCTRWKKVR